MGRDGAEPWLRRDASADVAALASERTRDLRSADGKKELRRAPSRPESTRRIAHDPGCPHVGFDHRRLPALALASHAAVRPADTPRSLFVLGLRAPSGATGRHAAGRRLDPSPHAGLPRRGSGRSGGRCGGRRDSGRRRRFDPLRHSGRSRRTKKAAALFQRRLPSGFACVDGVFRALRAVQLQ